MRTVEDSNDAPFGALCTRSAARAPLDLYKHMVPVHRVFDSIGRNEDVPVELRYQ